MESMTNIYIRGEVEEVKHNIASEMSESEENPSENKYHVSQMKGKSVEQFSYRNTHTYIIYICDKQ